MPLLASERKVVEEGFTSEESESDDSSCNATVECKVRFALEKNQEYPIIHIGDMTDLEIKSCWYQPKEWANMEKKTQTILTLIERGYDMDSYTGQTARGLEQLTRKGGIRAERNTRKTCKAVLTAQFEQICLEDVDEEELAVKSRAKSHRCRKEALERGTADAAVVRKDLEQARRQFAKLSSRKPSKSMGITAMLENINRPAALAA